MKWRDYFQTASVRQYAMISATVPLTGVFCWLIFIIQHFLDDKKFTVEQFYQLTKLQLQVLAFFGYATVAGILLIVVALTLTKFSAVTKAGSLTVGGDDENHQDDDTPKQVVVTTTVEKKDAQPPVT